jgi:predicted nucleic acid-binding protein
LAKLVIDANRIISALLKGGSTRSAILETRATLFAPEILQDEIAKHAPEIARRVAVSETELVAILRPLLKRIEWVSEAHYRPFLKRAKDAMEKVDPKDVAYLACALAVEADAIWSHDLDFDQQNLVPRVAHPSARIP